MLKDIHILLSVLTLAAICGCSRQAGVIFPPREPQITWPGDDQPARIRYVGELKTNEDLKPGRSTLDAIGQSLFGKPEVRTMATPFAACTDGADRVFVADSAARVIHVFNLKSRKYAQWTSGEKEPPLQQPVGIAWDASRARLLVSDSMASAIFAFDTDGRFAGQIGKGVLKRPCGMALQAGTGNIYVADSGAHQVVVFGTSGAEMTRIGNRGVGPGEFNFPIGVAIDSQGRIYIVDALNFRIQQFSPDMKVRVIGAKGDTPGSFAQPKAVSIDGDDHVYVVDNRFEAIQIFDAEGQLLLNFGREGHGPGEFWLPTSILIDRNNRIWVADSYNKRVQVFDYLPEKK